MHLNFRLFDLKLTLFFFSFSYVQPTNDKKKAEAAGQEPFVNASDAAVFDGLLDQYACSSCGAIMRRWTEEDEKEYSIAVDKADLENRQKRLMGPRERNLINSRKGTRGWTEAEQRICDCEEPDVRPSDDGGDIVCHNCGTCSRERVLRDENDFAAPDYTANQMQPELDDELNRVPATDWQNNISSQAIYEAFTTGRVQGLFGTGSEIPVPREPRLRRSGYRLAPRKDEVNAQNDVTPVESPQRVGTDAKDEQRQENDAMSAVEERDDFGDETTTAVSGGDDGDIDMAQQQTSDEKQESEGGDEKGKEEDEDEEEEAPDKLESERQSSRSRIYSGSRSNVARKLRGQQSSFKRFLKMRQSQLEQIAQHLVTICSMCPRESDIEEADADECEASDLKVPETTLLADIDKALTVFRAAVMLCAEWSSRVEHTLHLGQDKRILIALAFVRYAVDVEFEGRLAISNAELSKHWNNLHDQDKTTITAELISHEYRNIEEWIGKATARRIAQRSQPSVPFPFAETLSPWISLPKIVTVPVIEVVHHNNVSTSSSSSSSSNSSATTNTVVKSGITRVTGWTDISIPASSNITHNPNRFSTVLRTRLLLQSERLCRTTGDPQSGDLLLSVPGYELAHLEIICATVLRAIENLFLTRDTLLCRAAQSQLQEFKSAVANIPSYNSFAHKRQLEAKKKQSMQGPDKQQQQQDQQQGSARSYVLFCTDYHDMVKERNPRLSFIDIGRVMSRIWQEDLSGDMRTAYKQLAKTRDGQAKQIRIFGSSASSLTNNSSSAAMDTSSDEVADVEMRPAQGDSKTVTTAATTKTRKRKAQEPSSDNADVNENQSSSKRAKPKPKRIRGKHSHYSVLMAGLSGGIRSLMCAASSVRAESITAPAALKAMFERAVDPQMGIYSARDRVALLTRRVPMKGTTVERAALDCSLLPLDKPEPNSRGELFALIFKRSPVTFATTLLWLVLRQRPTDLPPVPSKTIGMSSTSTASQSKVDAREEFMQRLQAVVPSDEDISDMDDDSSQTHEKQLEKKKEKKKKVNTNDAKLQRMRERVEEANNSWKTKQTMNQNDILRATHSAQMPLAMARQLLTCLFYECGVLGSV